MNTSDFSSVPATLWDVFSLIPDRRGLKGRRYSLPALLMIALAAMLCGRKTTASIARWAAGLLPEELQSLGIKERHAPSQATWCRFFQNIEVSELEFYLGAWVIGKERGTLGHVAIDGKCLRGSFENGRATYLLSAYSERLKGVIGTVRVKAAGCEISGMLELLKQIPLEGTIITGDAAFTRRVVARDILAGGEDYFFVVKGNHKMLHRDIAVAFGSMLGCRTSLSCISKGFGGFCSWLLRLRTGEFHIPPNYVVTPRSSHNRLDLSGCYPHHVSSTPTATRMEMRHGQDRQSDPREPHPHRRFPR